MWGIGAVRPDQRVKIDKRNVDNNKENIENKTEIKKIKENDNINNIKTKIQIYKKNKGKGKSYLMENNNNFFLMKNKESKIIKKLDTTLHLIYRKKIIL